MNKKLVESPNQYKLKIVGDKEKILLEKEYNTREEVKGVLKEIYEGKMPEIKGIRNIIIYENDKKIIEDGHWIEDEEIDEEYQDLIDEFAIKYEELIGVWNDLYEKMENEEIAEKIDNLLQEIYDQFEEMGINLY